MKSRNMDTAKRNPYVPPMQSHNPVFGAVQATYAKMASKYGLNNYFDVRQARNISYLPNILQRAKSMSHMWPDQEPKPGNATVARFSK